MKRIGALILTLTLLVCLCACGNKEDLAGTYQAELDLTSLVEGEDGLGTALGLDEDVTMSSRLIFTLELVLEADKTYTMTFDTDASRNSVEVFWDEMYDLIVEAGYKTAEASGVTREQLDEASGGDFRAYTEESLSELVDFDALLDVGEENGVWKAKNGKLYLTESEDAFGADTTVGYTYTLSGSKLTLDLTEDNSFDLEEIYDVDDVDELVFEKR